MTPDPKAGPVLTGAKQLTLHLLLAKFFLICLLTDSWMFLQSAVSPAILMQPDKHKLKLYVIAIGRFVDAVAVSHQGCLSACSQVKRLTGSFSIRLPMKSLAGRREKGPQLKTARLNSSRANSETEMFPS